MADKQEQVFIPDLGGVEDVEVIEILVAPGDTVAEEDSLITLESEKASMDVPSSMAGVVESIAVKVGDKVAEGGLILTLKAKAQAKEPEKEPAKKATASVSTEKPTISVKEVRVPDLGGEIDVDIIEVLVKSGDQIQIEDPLITLEGEKATMDVPSPFSGKVTEIKCSVGDKVAADDLILLMQAEEALEVHEKPKTEPEAEPQSKTPEAETAKVKPAEPIIVTGDVHAGPGVRRVAYEFGVDLTQIKGSGEKGRIVKEDVQQFVKQQLQIAAGKVPAAGFQLPKAPKIDFSKFGEIKTEPLSKIKKATAVNMHRNWLNIPHVTQFEEADVTEMEAFRQEQKAALAKQGIRLTPIVFLMKALVDALQQFPLINASLDETGEHLIVKHYYHIGVAVDTPNGLVVPVIRDVDQKNLDELAKELGEFSEKARGSRLKINELQGGCITISSLGGIGGTAFTPIINAPEVAILGVSKMMKKPVYQDDGTLVPRLMMPLSLSYDHRVIDGAEAARFIVYLANRLADIRTLLLSPDV